MSVEIIASFILQSPDGRKIDIAPVITRATTSYSLTTGMSLSVTVEDTDLSMLRNNYFQLNQEFTWNGTDLLISSVDISEGEHSGVTVSLELLEKSFQQMKRDFKPEVYKSSTGFDYARKVAADYGLKFVGERVKGKQQTIKVKSRNNRESTWAVLQRSASDNQYMCFIADNTLFFASPKYLLGRWGIDSVQGDKRTLYFVPLTYTQNAILNENRFVLMSVPSMRISVDSPKEGEGSAKIWGANATQLRAGMTVAVRGLSREFNGEFLVTSVSWDNASPEPVNISFATTSKLAPPDKAKIDQKISEITVISGSGS